MIRGMIGLAHLKRQHPNDRIWRAGHASCLAPVWLTAGSIGTNNKISPAETVDAAYGPALKSAFRPERVITVEWIVVERENDADTSGMRKPRERWAVRSVIGAKRSRPVIKMFSRPAPPSPLQADVGSECLSGNRNHIKDDSGEKGDPRQTQHSMLPVLHFPPIDNRLGEPDVPEQTHSTVNNGGIFVIKLGSWRSDLIFERPFERPEQVRLTAKCEL
jgi:hypothetical protein